MEVLFISVCVWGVVGLIMFFYDLFGPRYHQIDFDEFFKHESKKSVSVIYMRDITIYKIEKIT